MGAEVFFSCTPFTGAQPNLELKLSDFNDEPEDCFLGLTLAVKPSVAKLGK